MDLQRSLLIGAIAVLSFMLLTKWVDFKDSRATPQVQESSRLSAAAETDAPSLGDQAVASTSGSEEDLPQLADGQAQVDVEPVIDSGKERVVQVYTDVLQLAIDLEGGDIIELDLPKYPARIDTPDVPYVLLEDNSTRVYVAQSGLIGPDGIDRNGRPTYSTASSIYRLGDNSDNLVVDLSWQNDQGVKITKRFSFTRGDYLIQV
ncbi:MAG: membrane protein insertase YidC, partial [Halieaceae bacterium]|nr:membrane protein insertase YidC [Halieaceae bacterium]